MWTLSWYNVVAEKLSISVAALQLSTKVIVRHALKALLKMVRHFQGSDCLCRRPNLFISNGFTLVELMVVLTLIAVLATLAAPSFVQLIRATAISNGTNTFLSDMRFARSEAIRRGSAVVICRSDVPEATDPACTIDTGTGGSGWASGWIIFQDLDNHGSKSTVKPILRVQSPLTSINAINDSNLLSTKFRFTATGRLANANSATTLVFGATPLFQSSAQRTVCIGVGGRARIAGDGTATCLENL